MKARILQTADRLFYGEGIRAVGVDRIAAEAGISKRTLYNHFPSKDALLVAYLRARMAPLPLTDAPPAGQILEVFDRLQRSFARGGFRGCAFVNAVAELGEGEHEAKQVAFAFKEQRRLWFRDLLERLGVADAEKLATRLAILLDGAIATELVRRDPALAMEAREIAALLLRDAGVDLTPA